MYLKNMSRLKVKINCIDCNAERMITKACLKLVKRCKPCQKIHNREKARNRYRELKGIPLDKPIKEKEEKKVVVVEKVVKDNEVKEVKKVVTRKQLTPEEEAIRQERIAALLDLLPDKSTDNDW